MQLSSGTTLQSGKYKIKRVLGQGGFGITYLASLEIESNQSLGKIRTTVPVTIKEFFMKEHCNRDASTSRVSISSQGAKELVENFKRKFIKEAQTLASLEHPNIVKIYDVFEENGTAYYAMEYIDGGSLSDYISQNGPMPEETAIQYIVQVAGALDYLHSRKMNHLDVKPGNILLNAADNAILIDFGLSKHYDDEGQATSTTPVGISHGYAPMEQYKRGGVNEFSPATDIYSLGATLYKLLTGQTPPDASDVYDDGLPNLSEKIRKDIRKAVISAMQPRKKDRPQSIKDFLSYFTDISNVIDFSKNEEVEVFNVSNEDDEATTFQSHIIRDNGYEMVYVEGGTFTMGATIEQGNDADNDETPAHIVTLSSYYIGRYPVTQQQWNNIMGYNPSLYMGDNHPISNISWDEAQSFISKLNARTGKNYRLPTEAEWEFAARGGNQNFGYKYSGSNNLFDVAWFEENANHQPHQVGTKAPNELGIYDMSGNVLEWCQDLIGDYTYGEQTNPKGSSYGLYGNCHILRGGNYHNEAKFCRVSCRMHSGVKIRRADFGFRLAIDAD